MIHNFEQYNNKKKNITNLLYFKIALYHKNVNRNVDQSGSMVKTKVQILSFTFVFKNFLIF